MTETDRAPPTTYFGQGLLPHKMDASIEDDMAPPSRCSANDPPAISVTDEFGDSRRMAGDLVDGLSSCSGDPSTFPGALFVIKMSSKSSHETISWLSNLIERRRRDGGAELSVRMTRLKHHGKTNILFLIGASTTRLFEGAELMDMKKRDNEGFLREFTVNNLDIFLNKDTNCDNLLSKAEKQRVILYELKNIRAKDKQEVIGCKSLKLYPGQSVVQVLSNEGIISQMYPLHDNDCLAKLGEKWYRTFLKNQPIDEIREYFGEEIAVYFAFLGSYTLALAPPAIIGILQLISSVDTIQEYAFFAIFNLIWVTLFLEIWKRNCSELAYNWGTIDLKESYSEVRPDYHGVMTEDSVTGRYQPHYPAWKRYCKVYCVSLPLIILCIVAAIFMMFTSIISENKVVMRYKENQNVSNKILAYLPSIVYAVVVWIVNLLYRELATKLTDWENHRTQASYDNHKIVKVVLFEFVNNFMSMFYIAFYIQDMDMLRWQVAVMLIIQQMVNHLQEAFVPYVLRKYRCRKTTQCFENVSSAVETKTDHLMGFHKDSSDVVDAFGNMIEPVLESLGIAKEAEDETENKKVHQAIHEGRLDSYQGVDDYLEVFVQFGYVFLFSSVYPLAAFWAIINNVLEIRADAFKLCQISQRPIAHPARDIGAWQIGDLIQSSCLRAICTLLIFLFHYVTLTLYLRYSANLRMTKLAFELLGAVAVITNIALLGMAPSVRSLAPNLSSLHWVLLMVAVEHIILLTKFLVAYLIPDTPGWVIKALQKIDYQTKQAVKYERSLKTRQHLRRARMRSAHVMSPSSVRHRIARGLSRD